jgi:phosphopentomutase
MKSGRVCILMMDSLGIGASLDAVKYGDEKANTLAHIIDAFPKMHIPNLTRWGLLHALELSSGLNYHGNTSAQGQYGFGIEQSHGKDTPSGHWEMMGLPVLFDWGYFPETIPCFPEELIAKFLKETGLKGVLGNCHASGTEIIDRFGQEHHDTGFPIVYTSADSVFQIAAHEEHFGLERLYEICEVARKLVDEYKIGRVIARPFVGKPGAYVRTANRRDYTTPPFAPTLLDHLKTSGHRVYAIGKIADIFAHQGVTDILHGEDNQDLFNITLETMKKAPAGSLVFTNFVDFDSKYGHRRDIEGYAKALEQFDKNLLVLESMLQPEDIVFLVADHGCDPTLAGSDHTREHIPIVMFGPQVKAGSIGPRQTFADVGQTIAEYLEVPALNAGQSFLKS